MAKKQTGTSRPPESLRERAEATLRKSREDVAAMATAEIQTLVHELQVHQIELKIQNEELRQSQHELAESRDRYADLYDFAPVGYLTLAEDGQILEANLTMTGMLGLERQKILGINLSRFINRDSQDAFYLHRRAVFSSELRQSCELVLKKHDGTQFVTQVESICFQSPSTHQKCCRMAFSDITDRKQYEENIQRLNATLEQRISERTQEVRLLAEAVANLGEGVMITDGNTNWPESRIRYVNQAMCDITGYRAEELIGHSPEILQSGSSDHRAAVWPGDDLKQQRPHLCESVSQHKNGTLYNAEWFISPIFDYNGKLANFIAIHRDITELNQAREKLLQAERLSAIGEAMTGLTHESRNALARSHANLRRLSRRLSDQPELLQLIDAAIKAQDDLGLLFEEVRQYAAPVQLKYELTDMGQLIEETWELLALDWTDRAVSLRCHDAGLNLECQLDRFHIQKAIRNILENSLSACQNPAEIDITFSEVQNGDRQFLQIGIRDNGPGFTADQTENIFDAFYTTKTHGTGLGLSITKRVIERHGGRITLGSRGKNGAEIILTLPRRQT